MPLLLLPFPACRLPLRPLLTVLCALVVLGPVAEQAQSVELSADTDVATAGYFQLRWTSEQPVVLQEATSPDFDDPRTIYRGGDGARVMSGKQDGDWYYRVRTNESGSEYGEPVKVTVRHHPLERAFGFFALGAFVFLATIYVIITGARSES